MYGLVYEYEVDPACVVQFEDMYGPDGEWAGFFRGSVGYLGTDLLRDSTRPGRYLLIDRWTSADAVARFLADRAQEYERRSRATAHLYLREVRLGGFDAVAPG
jgi:heme-degrading monooxygenase HmoA